MTPDDPSNLPLATDLNYDRNPTPHPTPPIPNPPHPNYDPNPTPFPTPPPEPPLTLPPRSRTPLRYNIAARNMGIRHTVSKDLQVELHAECLPHCMLIASVHRVKGPTGRIAC